MSLLPDEIAGKTFRRRWRGYAPEQVDGFLQRAATDYSAAIHRISTLAEERSRAQQTTEILGGELTAIAGQARADCDAVRRQADADAASMRKRAEHAAAAIVRQAEEAAASITRHAQHLRAEAETDAEAARQHLADTHHRARRLEEETHARCAAMRAEIATRRERLAATERRLAERLRDTERAIATLRSQADLLSHVQQLEQLLTTARADTQTNWAELGTEDTTNGAADPLARGN